MKLGENPKMPYLQCGRNIKKYSQTKMMPPSYHKVWVSSTATCPNSCPALSPSFQFIIPVLVRVSQLLRSTPEKNLATRISNILKPGCGLITLKLSCDPLGIVTLCPHGSIFLQCSPRFYPIEQLPQNHTQGPNFCTMHPLLAYQEFLFFVLMLVTVSRVVISVPCSSCWYTGTSYFSA